MPNMDKKSAGIIRSLLDVSSWSTTKTPRVHDLIQAVTFMLEVVGSCPKCQTIEVASSNPKYQTIEVAGSCPKYLTREVTGSSPESVRESIKKGNLVIPCTSVNGSKHCLSGVWQHAWRKECGRLNLVPYEVWVLYPKMALIRQVQDTWLQDVSHYIKWNQGKFDILIQRQLDLCKIDRST